MHCKSLLLVSLLAISLCAAWPNVERTNVEGFALSPEELIAASEPKVRTKRGIFWNFFQKLVITKNLVVDQFVDTKDTVNAVYNMINNQFSDPTPNKPTISPTTTTEAVKLDFGDDESTTDGSTTEAYKISRYEFGQILGRNFRGLQRLYDIEVKDALNATKYNLQEYKAEADEQFANSVAVEKKKQFKLFKG